MKFQETKTVEVDGVIYPVRLTSRAIIGYDTLTGRNFWVDFGGEEIKTEKILQLFYVTAKEGARSEGKKFDHTFDQFLDIVDDPLASAIFYETARSWFEGGEEKAEKKK